MKRIIVALMCVVLTLCFGGCFSKESQYKSLAKDTEKLYKEARITCEWVSDNYNVEENGKFTVSNHISKDDLERFSVHYIRMNKYKKEILDNIQQMREIVKGDEVLTYEFKKSGFLSIEAEFKQLDNIKKKVEDNYKNPKTVNIQKHLNEFAKKHGIR